MGFASFQGMSPGGSPLSRQDARPRRRKAPAAYRGSSCSFSLVAACSFVQQTKRSEIARTKLSDLPKLGLNDRHRAHESAETRSIHSQDHGHVSRKIHRSDGICVVVNVRGMQSGLAAVLARPFWLRSDQANACARGIVMNFPIGREEDLDVFLREKVRSAMRAVEDADFPAIFVARRVRRSFAKCPRTPGSASFKTSPARRILPPWPPNFPSVKVAWLPR